MMLDRNNQTMARNKLLGERTRHVDSCTECDDGREGVPIFLVAEGAGVEGFLGPCVVWGSAEVFVPNKADR